MRLYRGQYADTRFALIADVLPSLDQASRTWWVTHRFDVVPLGGKRPNWLRFYYPGVRYCPLCLGDDGIHRELWTMPLVAACPRHHCVLVTQCHSCRRGLTWGRIKPAWRCACGANLANAPALPAVAWMEQLAGLLEEALSVEDVLERIDACKQIYGFLAWAQELHLRLRLGCEPAGIAQPDARAYLVPGNWEVGLFMARATLGERRIRALVRKNFRGQQKALLLLDEHGPLVLAIEACSKLAKSCYSTPLLEAADALLSQLCASSQFARGLYFHPHLSAQRKQDLLLAFANWWYALAGKIWTRESPDRLTMSLEDSGGYSADLIIEILNELFDAAFRDEQPERYSTLIARWHIPNELKQKFEPSEVLDEVVSYLAGLCRSELNFVLDLICQC